MLNTQTLVRAITVVAVVAVSATGPVAFSAQGGTRPMQAQNPPEHLAHQDVDEGKTPCAAVLEQAWEHLGHFSDGYEQYLLTQPPCA